MAEIIFISKKVFGRVYKECLKVTKNFSTLLSILNFIALFYHSPTISSNYILISFYNMYRYDTF